MARKWITTPLPIQGSGGEQPDAATGLLEPGRARLIKNGVILGPGIVGQEVDWLKADICKNIAGPVENHAVCGIYPFAQQGGASGASAGVAFSFNGDDDKVYLHQLAELGTILRTLEAFASFTNVLPPQITGFEMFGKFYFVPFRTDEGVTLRKGMGVFDPAGAGAITFPPFVLAGGAATALRFRGISLHRGATILGWGYFTEADQQEDHVLRYCKYGVPDTWVPDATDTTAGFINVGTLKLPIIACAMSGQYTIIGKETEIFALDGDFSAQFYYRKIGSAHGPVSTVGMVEIPEAAVWMALKGPVISENGNPIELIAIDRVLRRFLSYMDLTTCWAVHDADRQRAVWGLRRKDDEDGNLVSSPYLTELLWWDYARRAFGTSSLPAPIFSLGVIRGPGISLPAPSGVVSAINASSIGISSATIGWTPGDSNPDVTFQVQRRVTGTSPWTDAGTTSPATYSKALAGLAAATHYDVQVRQIRNGQASAYVQAIDLFTTLSTPATPPDPTGMVLTETGGGVCFCAGGVRYEKLQTTFLPFTSPDTMVVMYESTINDFATAVQTGTCFPGDGLVYGSYSAVGAHIFVWLRSELITYPDIKGNAVVAGNVNVISTGGVCDGSCA